MATTLTAGPVARGAGGAAALLRGDADADASAAALVPEARAFGRYTLRYRVGTGGMAQVYLAQARAAVGFRKWVALKLVQPHLATDPRFMQMFFDEARLAARIEHPNVCTVFDFGEVDGTHFLAMEYLHGEPLTEVMRRAWGASGAASATQGAPGTAATAGVAGGGIPPALAARVVADAARGLHAAHELRDARGELVGVVHRDVSPQNIFVLYDGVSKVVDFGIARWSDRLVETTSEGELRGKLPYMAPEQVRHEPVDRRTDVFALGVVLWEATLGRRLFKRDNPGATCMAVLSDPIPPPRAIAPEYPPALEAVVMKALARAPDARFATADALARALEDYVGRAGQPAGAAHLADFMRALFAERVAARTALLRRELGVDADDTLVTDAPEADDDDEIDTVRDEFTPSRAAAASGPERTSTVSAVGRVGAAQRSAAGAPAVAIAARGDGGDAVTTASVPRALASRAGSAAGAARAQRAWLPWAVLLAVAGLSAVIGVSLARGTHGVGPDAATAPRGAAPAAGAASPVVAAPRAQPAVAPPPPSTASTAPPPVAPATSSTAHRARGGSARSSSSSSAPEGARGGHAAASTGASGGARMMRNFDRIE